jgi:hypothetical protein
MNDGPKRLRHDPDFAWETGCDLSDEAFVLGGYDLPAMRAKVLVEVLPPSLGAPLRPAAPVRPWFAVLAGGGVVAAALIAVGFWSASDVPPSATQPDASPAIVAPTPWPVAPEAPSSVAPVVASPPAASAAPVAAPQRAERVEPAEVPSEVESVAVVDDPPVATAPAAQPSAPAPAGTLADELRAFDAARDAASDGRVADARRGYDDYLARYPHGRLRQESEVGLLFALVDLGEHAAVDVLAGRLANDPAMSSRHAEILRVRAENLVALGRCSDAITIIKDLPARDGADVRRACRWDGSR